MTVYIIILHFKNIKDTITCLASINKLQQNGPDIKVMVVDNSVNIKNQISNIKNTDKKLKIITNKKNLGFAAGINVGIREALQDKSAAYVLILNNDTILPLNLLTELLKTPRDITTPVIKFKWKNDWKYDFGGKVNWWTGRTTHIESTNYPINQLTNYPIDYVSGCCMLVKREVFESIGLFDEKYFFYFEDADFCVRAKKAGFNITVNPNVSIYHKLGGAIGLWSNKAIFYNLTSNAIFITKHLGFRIPIGFIYLFILTFKILVNKSIRK